MPDSAWVQKVRAPGPLSVGLAVIAWLCLLLVVYLSDTPKLSGRHHALLAYAVNCCLCAEAVSIQPAVGIQCQHHQAVACHACLQTLRSNHRHYRTTALAAVFHNKNRAPSAMHRPRHRAARGKLHSGFTVQFRVQSRSRRLYSQA